MKRYLPFLLLLGALAVPAGAQEDTNPLAAADRSGAIYSATGRYNNRNNYIHIAKMDSSGYLIWETDYNTGADLKPVSVSVTDTNVYVVAAGTINGRRGFSVIRYSSDRYLVWDRQYSDSLDNVPVASTVDTDGNVYICGNARENGYYRARLWKYNSSGVLRWVSDYPAGTNTYARQLQILFNGDIAMGVSIFTGSDNYGQFESRSITFSSGGALLMH